MKRNVIITYLLMEALQLQAQVDPLEKAFDVSPTTIYKFVVGILVLFGMGAVTLFIWMFKRLWNWLEGYLKERTSGDGKRTGILENLLTETKTTNSKMDTLVDLQTAQGEKIAHIDNKVGAIEKDLDVVKSKIGNLETDLQNLKG